jgi:hypothetical protein
LFTGILTGSFPLLSCLRSEVFAERLFVSYCFVQFRASKELDLTEKSGQPRLCPIPTCADWKRG